MLTTVSPWASRLVVVEISSAATLTTSRLSLFLATVTSAVVHGSLTTTSTTLAFFLTTTTIAATASATGRAFLGLVLGLLLAVIITFRPLNTFMRRAVLGITFVIVKVILVLGILIIVALIARVRILEVLRVS